MSSQRSISRQPALIRRALGATFSGPSDEELHAAVAGRTVLITGASSGIGEATARRVGAAGAHVILIARRQELLEKVAAEVVEAGGSASVYPVDLTDLAAVEVLVERLLADHPAIDVVVNNAGRSIKRPLAESYDRFHDFSRTIEINYLGPVKLLLGLLPAMRARGSGHLVNVGTVAVDVPGPYWSAYAASKGAFEYWLWSAAPELRADGITTSSIHFGIVHTAMSAPTFAGKRGGMSAREAGNAVCRAIARKPRLLRPWWAKVAVLTGMASPGLADFGMTVNVRMQAQRNRFRRR